MSDTIKLVVEMPKEDYEFTKGARTARFFSEEYYVKLILNGTPLPEDFSLEDYERYKKDSESLSWMKYPDRMGN